MNHLIANKQIRKQARLLLKGNWLKMATIEFLFLFIKVSVNFGVTKLIGSSPNGIMDRIIFFIFYNFLFYVLADGMIYCSLRISRGKKVKLWMLLEVFRGKYYVTLVFIRLIQTIIGLFLGKIIFLSELLLGEDLLITSNFFEFPLFLKNFERLFHLKLTVIISVVIFMFLFSLIFGYVIFAIEFTILVKLDNPMCTFIEAIGRSFFLMKGNYFQYILLDLSFIIWMILSSLTFGIGNLFASSYRFVSTALFYNTICKEKFDSKNVII